VSVVRKKCVNSQTLYLEASIFVHFDVTNGVS